MIIPNKDYIYDPEYVSSVFDRCSVNYRLWSQIASFGFVYIWRRQCVQSLPIIPFLDAEGMDLMAGTGEAWPYLLKTRSNIKSITAVDISTEMNVRAIDLLHKKNTHKIKVKQSNLLESDIDSESVEFAISTFGLKTFNEIQQVQFAKEFARILKSGGVFSFIEASDPKGWIFQPLYIFYISKVLPLIERLFLNGAQDFCLLATYASNFKNCDHFAECLKKEGLIVQKKSYFFGCATGVVGQKP